MFFTILLAGCYSPAVPTGGYRCSAVDHACPSNQHCSCGLCVKSDDEAACSFAVEVGAATVREHQQFSVTITAKAADGTPAAGFNDTVALSFLLADGTRWADVRPSTVALQNGKAQAMVSVNRETIPPQTPSLTAEFAGNLGRSPGITVVPRPFVKQVTPSAVAPFGWADRIASEPSVLPDGDKLRMYFTGYSTMLSTGAIGLAFSSDGGKSFQPTSSPVFPATGSVFQGSIISATAFQNNGWQLAIHPGMGASPQGDIILANSTDGIAPFGLSNGGNAILKRGDCPYCDFLAWFPSLLQLPLPPAASSSALSVGGDWLMFFGSGHCIKPGGCVSMDGVAMSIGRARSADGIVFTPEPAPVLSGEQGGEAYLAAPVVMLDGSVYKLWYAFSRGFMNGDPCQSNISLGYATSSDGFYWVRSPANPVLVAGGGSWDMLGLVATTVLPIGGDPENGLQLFYSDFGTVPVPPFCVPMNVGLATAL